MSYALVFLLFVISGAISLGYQVLWSRCLLDVIGVSSYSYATVLAAFMGGLALGSWLLGKRADRMRSPLRLYAYLELGVGAYAVVYLPLNALLASTYANLVAFSPEHAGATIGLWAKIALSAILLLPPTILMGGTYPTLMRFATTELRTVGKRAAQLYAANAAGAVLGSLLTAFLVMPLLGTATSLSLFAILNGLVAAGALCLASIRKARTDSVGLESSADEQCVPWSAPAPRLVRLFAIAVGFLAFVYEIAWTRYFGLVVGSSTYSFAVMLAAFITGITIGSAILVRIERRIANPLSFLGWSQIGAAALVLLPLPIYPYVPWLFKRFVALLSTADGAFYLFELGKLLFCFGIMLPPTILLGMGIPLLVKAVSRSRTTLGADAGAIYAWDTWGNVLGALLGGLFLLPALGLESLLRVTTIASALVGLLAVIAFSPKERRGTRFHAYRALPAGLVVAVGLLTSGWDAKWFSIFPYRRSSALTELSSVRGYLANKRVLLFEDDPATNLMVTELRDGSGQQEIALLVNGKVDASWPGDMATQVLLGHVPMLLHPRPRDIMIVGLASGITAGAVLQHHVAHLDVVELAKQMPRATAFFDRWNGGVLSDPLFTAEYYRRVNRALRPDGLFAQWFQSYEASDATVLMIVRTLRSTFSYVYGFQGAGNDLLLIAGRQPISLNPEELRQRIAQPAVARQLAEFGITGNESFSVLQRFSPGTARVMAAMTDEINTDDNQNLEYRAPRELFVGAAPTVMRTIDERLTGAAGLFLAQLRNSQGEKTSVRALRDVLVQTKADANVVEAFQTALKQLRDLGDASIAGVAPDALLPGEWSTPSPQELVAAVDSMIASDAIRPAADLIERHRAAILLESAMSTRAAQYWQAAVGRWTRATQRRQHEEAFGRLWVELRAAEGQSSVAARELYAWASSTKRPAEAWALSTACRLDPDRLCSAVAEIYAARNPTGIAAHLRAPGTPNARVH
jgi:spermidine synthase